MKRIKFVFLLLLTTSGLGQSAKEVENRLLGHLSHLEKYSNYGGTSDYEQLEKINGLLKAALKRLGRSPATLAYSFPRLKEKMFVSTSKDRKFRVYSWDEETGGTMHDFDSVFQFKGSNGKIYTWSQAASDGYDIGGFYHDVFQVSDRSGPVYLLVSTVIGSTSLAGQSISAFRVDGRSLDRSVKIIRTASGVTDSISFEYDFFTVVDRPERPIKLFKFDPLRMTFSFPVVIEDAKTPQGRVTDKMINYRFDGKYFVKTN